jgi:hypothetical protein
LGAHKTWLSFRTEPANRKSCAKKEQVGSPSAKTGCNSCGINKLQYGMAPYIAVITHVQPCADIAQQLCDFGSKLFEFNRLLEMLFYGTRTMI